MSQYQTNASASASGSASAGGQGYASGPSQGYQPSSENDNQHSAVQRICPCCTHILDPNGSCSNSPYHIVCHNCKGHLIYHPSSGSQLSYVCNSGCTPRPISTRIPISAEYLSEDNRASRRHTEDNQLYHDTASCRIGTCGNPLRKVEGTSNLFNRLKAGPFYFCQLHQDRHYHPLPAYTCRNQNCQRYDCPKKHQNDGTYRCEIPGCG